MFRNFIFIYVALHQGGGCFLTYVLLIQWVLVLGSGSSLQICELVFSFIESRNSLHQGGEESWGVFPIILFLFNML